MSKAQFVLAAALVMFAFGTGCDGRIVMAGNLFLATIPCLLLWLTVNLQRSR